MSWNPQDPEAKLAQTELENQLLIQRLQKDGYTDNEISGILIGQSPLIPKPNPLNIQALAKTLENESEVFFVHDNKFYSINEHSEGGYDISVYDAEDIQPGLEAGVADGGICTGNALDAITFMLPEDIEQLTQETRIIPEDSLAVNDGVRIIPNPPDHVPEASYIIKH